jgi:drug/metabolite transporter (DMT)-like permease
MTASVALWSSIVLGACAQVLLKRGVSRTDDREPALGLALLRSPWVLGWAFCFVLATGLWLVALSRIEISYAFPLLSIGYPIVAVLSLAILKERITLSRWLAILVITIGVAIISRSA